MRCAMVCSLAFVLAGAVGCSTDSNARAGKGAEEAAAPEGTVAPGRAVVVPSSAEFSSGTGASAERWSYDAGEYWRFEVVSTEDDWVELRVPEEPDSEAHCYGVPAPLHAVGLRVFVKRDELLKVTTETVEATADDETGIALRPGVVVQTGGGRATARLHGLEIPVPTAVDRIGRAYQPANSAPPSADAGWWRTSGPLTVAGAEVGSPDGPLPVRKRSERGERTLAEITDGCGTVRALLDSATEASAPEAPDPTPSEKFQVTWAKPDATVYWLDGSEAGRVRGEKWPLRVEVESRNDRPCFAASFESVAPKTFESERHFRVCFDASDLETPEEAAQRRAGTRSDDSDGGAVSVLETAAEIRLVGMTGDHKWEDVKRPVASQKNALESCYKEAVSPEHKFAGKVRMTISIAADGSVDGVATDESTLGEESVPACLRETLREASFPSAGGASDLEVELVFSVEDT